MSQLLPHQVLPVNRSRYWLLLAQRARGKTRAGAEFIIRCTNDESTKLGVIGPNLQHLRDIMMFGESGLLTLDPGGKVNLPWRKIMYPRDGYDCLVSGYSAEKDGSQLLGSQFDAVWLDELALWSNTKAILPQIEFCTQGLIAITTSYPEGPQLAYDPHEPISRYDSPKAYIDWLIEMAKRGQQRVAVTIV